MRSFRIGPGGVLYPLFHDIPWTAPVEVAVCRAGGAEGRPVHRPMHAAPEPDCSCGIYAYGTLAATAEYAASRHVLAVVACWGHVIAGTRGLRTQYARIEAVWTSPRVPDELVDLMLARLPGVARHTDRAAMLAAHPLTALDCYEAPEPPPRRATRIALALTVITALVIASLPTSWLWPGRSARTVWTAELVAFVGAAAMLALARRDLRAAGPLVVAMSVMLWLAAPLGGTAGSWLLRLPLGQIVVLAALQRGSARWAARRFPARIPHGPPSGPPPRDGPVTTSESTAR